MAFICHCDICCLEVMSECICISVAVVLPCMLRWSPAAVCWIVPFILEGGHWSK